MNERRIGKFAEELGGWSYDVERALAVEGNAERFRNEFRDMYDAAFPWVEGKRRGRIGRSRGWMMRGSRSW